MSLDIIEQILEMQNYSAEKISISAESVRITFKKKESSYCCPNCRQQTFSGYDSRWRIVEDLPMSSKRVFLEIPVYRLYCSSCRKVLTEYIPFIQPLQRYTNRFIAFIHHLCAISTIKEVSELTGLHWGVH